jgi:hypothetical protein
MCWGVEVGRRLEPGSLLFVPIALLNLFPPPMLVPRRYSLILFRFPFPIHLRLCLDLSVRWMVGRCMISAEW